MRSLSRSKFNGVLGPGSQILTSKIMARCRPIPWRYPNDLSPVSAAVAVETLKIYEERGILAEVRKVGPYLQEKLQALADHPPVGEARGVGLIGAVHIVADKASRAPVPPAAGMGPLIQQRAMDRGLLIRAAPDAVYVCPPLIIAKAEIDELAARCRRRWTMVMRKPHVGEWREALRSRLHRKRRTQPPSHESPWPGFAEKY